MGVLWWWFVAVVGWCVVCFIVRGWWIAVSAFLGVVDRSLWWLDECVVFLGVLISGGAGII